MTTATPTTAGLLAPAGVARIGAYGPATVHQGSAHLLSTWTQGAIAKPDTCVMFDRKNRPTRPLSERSP